MLDRSRIGPSGPKRAGVLTMKPTCSPDSRNPVVQRRPLDMRPELARRSPVAAGHRQLARLARSEPFVGRGVPSPVHVAEHPWVAGQIRPALGPRSRPGPGLRVLDADPAGRYVADSHIRDGRGGRPATDVGMQPRDRRDVDLVGAAAADQRLRGRELRGRRVLALTVPVVTRDDPPEVGRLRLQLRPTAGRWCGWRARHRSPRLAGARRGRAPLPAGRWSPRVAPNAVSVAISNVIVTGPTGPRVGPLVTCRTIGLRTPVAPFTGSVGIGGSMVARLVANEKVTE